MLTSIDPEWAWAPFYPSDRQPWSRRLAAHLFRRAGFAANLRELDQALENEPQAVVRRLVTSTAASPQFQQESENFASTLLATGKARQISAWWLYTMLTTPHPLLEKTTLFWHGHFATSAEKVQDAVAMYNQNQLLRKHALGSFPALVHGISRDPAMLIYLDCVTNRKSHPNENYARELMELFCLGEGNYSEQDVQQLARCFTGWEIRRGRFRFNRYQHDIGDKRIFGKVDSFPNGQAIDLVLDQPSGPRFIAGKLIRYFVFDEPTAPEALIEPLANQLRESDWDIGDVVSRILGSNLFFSAHALGQKVRSPVDLIVGLMRSLEASTNAQQLSGELVRLGQGLFFPPNVKGWDGGRTWINSSTLLGRANLVGKLIHDDKTRFAGGNLDGYFAGLGANSAEQIVDTLDDLLLATSIPDSPRHHLVKILNQSGGGRSDRIAETVHALSTMPEFHIG